MTGFWRAALLTLLMALLPLRGWAWAVMPVPAQDQAAAQGVSGQFAAPRLHGAHAPTATPLHHAAERAAPCHAHQAAATGLADAGADATPLTTDTSGAGHTHTCSLCDLCHAGVIVPPSWAWFHEAPPVSPPSWAVSAAHGRVGTDGLCRPPRG